MNNQPLPTPDIPPAKIEHFPLTKKQLEFIEVYLPELVEQVKKDPTEYAWPVSEAATVASKMVRAMTTGSANVNSSPVVRRTCKKLGIKCTIRDIRAFLEGE